MQNTTPRILVCEGYDDPTNRGLSSLRARMARLKEIAKENTNSRNPSPTWQEAYRSYKNRRWRQYPSLMIHRSERGSRNPRAEVYADTLDALEGCFREVRRSQDILPRLHHGWYADDPDLDPETYSGIVCRIPGAEGKPRFLAGWWTDDSLACVGRVDISTVYEDEEEAARAGDEEARCVAEREREYQEAQRAVYEAEQTVEEASDEYAESLERAKALRPMIRLAREYRKPQAEQTQRAIIREAIAKARKAQRRKEAASETLEKAKAYFARVEARLAQS